MQVEPLQKVMPFRLSGLTMEVQVHHLHKCGTHLKKKQTTRKHNMTKKTRAIPKRTPKEHHSISSQILVVVNVCSDSDMSGCEEDEVCCICERFRRVELFECVSLVFGKSRQCMFENCTHRTHLQFILLWCLKFESAFDVLLSMSWTSL